MAAALGMAALLAACDPADPIDRPSASPAAGMCLVGATDCNDTGVRPGEEARHQTDHQEVEQQLQHR